MPGHYYEGRASVLCLGKSFDPQYRQSTKLRSGTRAGKTLGTRNAGSRLGLVFELSQFFA